MLLEDALDGFWLSKRRNFSPRTVRDYELTFRSLQECLGNPEFASITATDLNRFMNYLEADLNLRPKTLLNHWVGLSSLWSWAEVSLEVPQIVRTKVARPKPKAKRSLPYTEAEVRALLEACGQMDAWNTKYRKMVRAKRPTGVRDRAVILVLVDTGIRATDMCDLKVRDYDKKRGQITIHHGKGDKKRVLYLGETARQAVWKYMATRPDVKPDDPLFATQRGGELDRSDYLHLIVNLGKKCGIKNAGLHRFRHTFAINFLRNGGDVLALQDMLGHEKMDTVRIYVKLASVDLENAQRNASPADNWRL